ncbi:MAG TPA: hypothetical protein EYG31_05550 [Porticoccaceae bacterium]|nr:hypothetical protein [Gammaproteobacteria bacterium]HIL60081.1 hypothetical protein [Porticoccaceae bacterium]
MSREALNKVKQLMATLERFGDVNIDNLYFTNFVVQ